MIDFVPQGLAALSVLMMGACGVQLLVRLVRVLLGREDACAAREAGRSAPVQEIALAVLASVCLRFAVYLLAWGMHRISGGEGSLLATLPRLWIHWDTRHYMNIAQNGYTAVGDDRLQLVFFPLYPLLMRAASLVTGGDVFLGGLLTSLVCAAACAGLLYALAYDLFGRRCAVLALAYFLLSPLSVFLGCAYTEALFICLTLAAIVLLRRGHTVWAALCGMLSAFTRMPGVIVAGLFIIRAMGRAGRRELGIKDVCACALQVGMVFAGLFAYWAINWLVTGDPLMYLTYQKENWFQQAGSFWRTVDNTAYYVLTTFGDGDWLYTWAFQLLCMFYVFALLCVGQKKLPFDLAAYSVVYVAVVLAPTWLLSGPRYLYALAPLPVLQARMHKGVFWHALALTLSALLLVLWVYGYAIAIEVL